MFKVKIKNQNCRIFPPIENISGPPTSIIKEGIIRKTSGNSVSMVILLVFLSIS